MTTNIRADGAMTTALIIEDNDNNLDLIRFI